MKIVLLVEDKNSTTVRSLASSLKEILNVPVQNDALGGAVDDSLGDALGGSMAISLCAPLSDPLLIFEIKQSFLTRFAPFVLFDREHKININDIAMVLIPAEGRSKTKSLIEQRKSQFIKLGVPLLDKQHETDILEFYKEKMKDLITTRLTIQPPAPLIDPKRTSLSNPIEDKGEMGSRRVDRKKLYVEGFECFDCFEYGDTSGKTQHREKWTNSRR